MHTARHRGYKSIYKTVMNVYMKLPLCRYIVSEASNISSECPVITAKPGINR